MKKRLLIPLACIIAFLHSSAQNVQIFPVPKILNADVSESDVILHTEVTHNSSKQMNLRWVRDYLGTAKGWQSAVCDTNACYGPEVDSADFVLYPGDTGRMDVYFYPNGIKGYGLAKLRVFEIANPSSFVANYYYCSVDADFVVDKSNICADVGQDTAITIGSIVNSSGSDYTLVIERINDDLPGGWSANLCGDTCLSLPGESMTINLKADSSFDLFGYFYTNSSDEGSFDVRISNPANMAYVDTFSFCISNPSTRIRPAPIKSEDFILFPNPARRHLNVVSKDLDAALVEIYNVIGDRVAKYDLAQNSLTSLPVYTLPSGMYFIRAISQDGKILNTKAFVRSD